MSRSRSPRAALSRMFVVLVASCGALVVTAGTSLAASVNQVNPNTAVNAVPSGAAIAGVSMGTFMWAVAGFGLLVLGFIAASRSGRRDVADSRSALLPAGSIRTAAPSGVESQGEPTPSAVTV